MIKNKLFKNALIYTLTEVINKSVPFLLIPILTMYLTPSDYGMVATYGAFTAIMTVFIHLSMTGAVSVNFFQLSKKQLKIYIANTLIIVFTAAFIALIIVLIFKGYLSEKLDISFMWLFIGTLVVLSQFFTILNLVLWQVEQRPKQFGLYQIVQMLSNTSLILIFVIGLNMKWEGQLIGQSSATILFSLISFGLIYHRGYLDFTVNKKYIIDALKFGIPLIPHALSGWFRVGVDRIFLTTLIGTSATGLYAVGYQLGMIVGIIAIAFNQAYSPYLFKKLTNITENGKIKLVQFTYIYFIGILFFASLISLIMPWFVINYMDEKYLMSAQFIPWISFGYAFLGMYFMVVNYIFYVKKTYLLSIVTFVSGLIHLLMSYVFISSYGVIGAAYATTLSLFLMFIFVWFLSTRIYPMPWDFGLMRIK